MKVLYISSGYGKIYTFFDQCILKELNNIKHVKAKSFKLSKGLSHLKSECRLFQPDIVLTLVGDKLPSEMLQWLKKMKFKIALWLTEDPYYIDRAIKHLPNYDYVFTIDIAALKYYHLQGFNNVYHLPLGTDPNTFSPKSFKKKYVSDICLIGYPYRSRVTIIKKLLKESSYRIIVSGGWQEHLEESDQLQIIRGWLPPQKVATYYSNAKIVLNTHRSYNEEMNENRIGVNNQSVNNRTFDIAACGGFQLIEHKEDLTTHFLKGEEIISFKSQQDLLEKVVHFFKNDKMREDIKEKGRQRVLLEHTFHHRLTKMINTISGS
ncbi:CgeB family protein [Alkalihalobacillus deserti]|uniref:CgeB family protein n=1 Tax=Alkalihalobacillus deserti TaxID=2879466 RepID=UPI001D133E56|nr:glycosyltransferase [Alkalihalobacillus deserti]